jgi:hypothetical protein
MFCQHALLLAASHFCEDAILLPRPQWLAWHAGSEHDRAGRSKRASTGLGENARDSGVNVAGLQSQYPSEIHRNLL